MLNRVTWSCNTPVFDETCPNFEICQQQTTCTVIATLVQIVGRYVPMVMYTALFIKAKKIQNQIIPSSTQEDTEQRKNKRQTSLFSHSFSRSLELYSVPPVLAYILIFAPLGINPPKAIYTRSCIKHVWGNYERELSQLYPGHILHPSWAYLTLASFTSLDPLKRKSGLESRLILHPSVVSIFIWFAKLIVASIAVYHIYIYTVLCLLYTDYVYSVALYYI